MIATLRESKARLSELVERASRGEEVLITVRGQPKARLTRAGAADAPLGAAWARQLRALQRTEGAPGAKLSIEQILAEDREDRT
jgi:prevent-host-death family protein